MLRKTFFDQSRRFRLVGIAIIILAYAPGVFRESFWSDDYPALMETQAISNHFIKDARPMAATLFSASYSLLDDPSHAWILRSFALIALLLIFLFFSKRLVNPSSRNIGTFSISVALCLPSFQMYTHWSIAWFYSWAILSGLYSFHFWTSSLLSRKLFGVFLLALALTTYPPAALFFLSAIAVVNTINKSKIPKYFSDVVQSLLLLTIAGVVSIVAVITTIQLAGFTSNRRVSLISLSEIPEKIAWLVSRPLVVGLRPFMIDSPTPKIALLTAIPVFITLLVGIRRQSLELGESIFLRTFWVIFPLILSLIPLMITPDNQIEFRILPGYSWGIAVLSSFFILDYIDTKFLPQIVNSKLKDPTRLLVPAVLALVSVISINSHYLNLFGTPYEKKTTFLNSEISFCIGIESLTEIIILAPEKPFPVLSRLGVFSMSTDLASIWVPKSNVELLLKKRNIAIPVTYLNPRPIEMKASPTQCVIDLEEFRKLLIE